MKDAVFLTSLICRFTFSIYECVGAEPGQNPGLPMAVMDKFPFKGLSWIIIVLEL